MPGPNSPLPPSGVGAAARAKLPIAQPLCSSVGSPSRPSALLGHVPKLCAISRPEVSRERKATTPISPPPLSLTRLHPDWGRWTLRQAPPFPPRENCRSSRAPHAVSHTHCPSPPTPTELGQLSVYLSRAPSCSGRERMEDVEAGARPRRPGNDAETSLPDRPHPAPREEDHSSSSSPAASFFAPFPLGPPRVVGRLG